MVCKTNAGATARTSTTRVGGARVATQTRRTSAKGRVFGNRYGGSFARPAPKGQGRSQGSSRVMMVPRMMIFLRMIVFARMMVVPRVMIFPKAGVCPVLRLSVCGDWQ